MDTPNPNAQQIDYWNTTMGATWVALNDGLDRQLRPFGLAAMDALEPLPGERMLDLGCGCGDTTLELARRVGPAGRAIGVDVSRPMLEVARRRAGGIAQASFQEADAQTSPLPAADGAFSRFGVMFFADPAAAFANVRTALAGGGRLAFVCWRALAENPWLAAPAAAAASVVTAPPPPAPDAPGPFAFADSGRVTRVLGAAGLAEVRVRPQDFTMSLGELDAAVEGAMRMGPAAMLVRENPDRRDAIGAAIRAALAPRVSGGEISLPAAVWIVSAVAP